MDCLTEQFIEDLINIYELPVPVTDFDNFVNNIGGSIIYNYIDHECFHKSFLKKVNNSFCIYVSPVDDVRTKRFMISQEIGHLFLHMGYKTNDSLWNTFGDNQIYENNKSYSLEKQIAANSFAFALLMPKTEYTRILNLYTHDGKAIMKKIADYFGVTVSFSIMRGEDLGLIKKGQL